MLNISQKYLAETGSCSSDPAGFCVETMTWSMQYHRVYVLLGPNWLNNSVNSDQVVASDILSVPCIFFLEAYPYITYFRTKLDKKNSNHKKIES